MGFKKEIFCGATQASRRATYKGSGYDPDDLKNRPHIGIANTYSDSSPGHVHLRPLVDAVKNGVWQAGGVPFEFGVPSTCTNISIGLPAMSYDLVMRDIVAASIELVASIQQYDGLVLTASCDNIVPGVLLAAARLNIPAIILTGGPMLSGRWKSKQLLLGDVNEMVYGVVAKEGFDEDNLKSIELAACPTPGACPLMGTANTMQILTEVLGMTLPGSSTIPGVFTDKTISARHTGRRIVEMVIENLRPSDIMTRKAIDNAITLDMAIGGSTNAVLHLIALGNELGIPVHLKEFNQFSDRTPCIINIKPTGTHAVDELYYMGGVPAICKQVEDLMNLDAKIVSGETWGEILKRTPAVTNDVIRSRSNPVSLYGGLTVLHGNLAEYGAIVRSSTIQESMRYFKGPARVFNSDEEAYAEIISDKLKSGDVIVIRYEGSVGAPGMNEVMLTTDALVNLHLDNCIALVTDGRFSGFNHGPIIGHVSPEAAIGGPLALVEDGDIIEIDINKRTLTLNVDDVTLAERRKIFIQPPPNPSKEFMRIYAKNCRRADEGAAMQL